MDKTRILVCLGTSGLSAGGEEVASILEKELKRLKIAARYKVVRTGDRGLFRDVLVDVVPPGGERITYEYVKPGDAARIAEQPLLRGEPVKELRAGEDYKRFFAGQVRIVLANCGEIDPEDIEDYIAAGGYKALVQALKSAPEKIIADVKKSGLRGRGGAGFLSGLKWEFCRREKEPVKYLVCNGDEGDPGAFMDRSILEGDPQAVLEGMLIAGYAIGASTGYIYCRAEYPLAIKRLEMAIAQARKKGFLGRNILKSGYAFDITIKQGAGAFVCGEETALLASIEGRRGMPVPRPPFPAQKGLWGKPTVINNVETFANVALIITKGADWFAAIGPEGSKGTKVFALAGKVKNTGLVEVPMGTTLRQLVFGPGGGMPQPKIGFKGVQIGGPSGGCLPESLLDTPIDYESITKTGAIMGSGGMVVMDKLTCMVDMARFFLDFTVSESCGKCVPCRVGLKRMLEVLEEICAGRGKPEHLAFLDELAPAIKDTALCGLGNTAPNSVLTTMKYFPEEYKEHIEDRTCRASVCTPLVKFEVQNGLCIKCGRCKGVCPSGAIDWEKQKYAAINKAKCIKCKACINICPVMAIK